MKVEAEFGGRVRRQELQQEELGWGRPGIGCTGEIGHGEGGTLFRLGERVFLKDVHVLCQQCCTSTNPRFAPQRRRSRDSKKSTI